MYSQYENLNILVWEKWNAAKQWEIYFNQLAYEAAGSTSIYMYMTDYILILLEMVLWILYKIYADNLSYNEIAG